MIERYLTFRLLRVYVTLVQTGSISETARQLHLTQPTVSIQLKKLQETVGQTLYIFKQQKFVLTEAGNALHLSCQRIFACLDEFNAQLTDIKAGHSGHLKIAMVNTAQYILPRLIGPFQALYPEIEITLEIGNREQVLQRFERGLDDLYVFSHPPSLEHAIAEPFLANPLVLVADKNHALSSRSNIKASDLVEHRFLMREQGSATRMMFDSFLQSKSIAPAHMQQLSSNEAIKVGISSGMGIGMLSQHVLDLQNSNLKVLSVDGLPLVNHWYFIARNDRYMPKTALKFLSYCQTSVTDILGKPWQGELKGKIVDFFTSESQ
ncbi:LysR family transcriptional regulator [Pseudoalteromonas phenolica]|uniref:LysR family transcriptional regulator n=1 Tax=Pseudoalteromonas phenolica TaxID=161398 RepID=UPI00110AF519|nr:LysR family transcriptional regulator [Pseudoalteromonas phenolica]TMO57167.1 LysR family transcriptional regulator [Pseudoalteromonas phenolica]